MMRPIGLYLAEFRPDGAPALPAALPLLPDLGAGLLDLPMPDMPPFDMATEFAPDADLPVFADEAPVAAEPAAPEPDTAAIVAERDAHHAEALAAARARWAAEEGAALAERLNHAFTDLETRLAASLAVVLEPFLAKAAQAKALDGLRASLTTLLGGGETRAVTVSGPADLVAALRERAGDRPGVAFAETDAPDVTIALGDTRVRSQLRAWSRKLDAALGAQA